MGSPEDEAVYEQADEQCKGPHWPASAMDGPCTCGDIKPFGYGPHVCLGDAPAPTEPTERTTP
jgi:cytochrome P450